MSVKASTWVWEHSQSEEGARLVLLALADHAGADGGDAWPSVSRLAERTHLSVRAVQYALRRLVEIGELEVKFQTGPRGTNRYRLTFACAQPVENSVENKGVQDLQGAVSDRKGCSLRHKGVQPTAPESKEEPKQNRDPRGVFLTGSGWVPWR